MTDGGAGRERQSSEIVIEDGDDNRINEVLLFTNQVQVNRAVRATAEPGLNRFIVESKAFQVDGDSAQARVFGKGEIYSVQYSSEAVKERPQTSIRELEQQKRELNYKLNALDDSQMVLDKQLQFLDSVIDFSSVQIPTELQTSFPNTSDLNNTLVFLQEKISSAVQQKQELTRKQDELKRALELVKSQLKQSGQRGGTKTRSAIEVLFQSQETQDVQLSVSYIAQGASWTPVYKVNVSNDLSDVDLTMFATIIQKTGEDWENTQLAFSNAVPLASGHLPELSSWYLQPPRPPSPPPVAASMKPMARRSKLQDADIMMDDLAELEVMEVGAAPEGAAAEYVQAEQKQLPLSFEFQYPRTMGLDSGSKETLLPLFTKDIPGKFYNYSIPQIDPQVYLVCEAESQGTLMPGRLNIHFGGQYLGNTYLGEKKAGDSLLLNLGAEREVKVLREKVSDQKTETFFGMVDRSSVARELKFRLVVENLKQTEQQIQIIDSVPVSTTDRYEIKGLEFDIEPTEKDWKKRQGVMLWKLTLAPNSVKEINIRFFVKHPKDEVPLGL